MQGLIFQSDGGYVSKLKTLWDEPHKKRDEPLDFPLTFLVHSCVSKR
jgi:hypothetical protein